MIVTYYDCCGHCYASECGANPNRHRCDCEEPGCVAGKQSWSYSEASE
jgi:hypothetical protein